MTVQILKPTENWTKFPNSILDNLDQFEPNEFKIIALMVRKNYGYDSANKQFSLNYICVKTGMKKPTANKSVKGLLSKGAIRISGTGDRGIHLYDIIWTEDDRLNNLTSTGKEIEPEPVKKINPLKETILKETNKRPEEEKKPSSSLTVKEKEKTAHQRLTEFFYKQYFEIYGTKMTIDGKEGKAIKQLTKMDESEVIKRASILKKRCKDPSDKFYVFTPSMLSSHWNKMVDKPSMYKSI